MSDKEIRDVQDLRDLTTPAETSVRADTPANTPGAAPGVREPTRSPRDIRRAREEKQTGGRRVLRWLRRLLIILAILAALFVGLAATGYFMASSRVVGPLIAEVIPEKGMTSDRIAAKTAAMEKKLGALQPKGRYLVIDTGANRLYVRDGDKLVREAIVSCGSGNILPNPFGGKDWVFDTPRGEFKIESKRTNPVWIKPDWAFVEEGKPIPPKNDFEERAEAGVLGDYALGIGRGFFLHGTLYTRMLGRNVTHGCVRIGDDDLKYIFDNTPIGTKVYLY